MSLNLENLVTAFESDSGKAADLIWGQVLKYLRTISDKQGVGLSGILLRRSPVARSSAIVQLTRGQKFLPSLIRSLSKVVKGTKTMDVGGPFLLNYAIEVLLVSTDAIRVSPGDFSGLFKSLTVREFADILAPALVRAMRRSASRSIRNVEGILECCSVDMSSSFTELVAALLESVTSLDLLEGVARSVAAVFRNCHSSDAIIGLLKQVSGAFSKFGQQSVDNSAAVVLTHLCHSGRAEGSVCDSLLASSLVVGLTKQLKASPSEEVRGKIATALGNASAFSLENSPFSPSALLLIKEELAPLLLDKKSTDGLKEQVILAIEKCAFTGKKSVTTDVVSIDSLLPFLPLLVQGRQTARTMCLAAWSALLQILVADPSQAGDKRLAAVFAQAVANDATFAPSLEADSALNRRLLRTIAETVLHVPAFPMTSGSEMETISLPSMSEKMKNRFCVNLLSIIAATSFTSFNFGNVTTEVANRMALAMYEIVVSNQLPGRLVRVAIAKTVSLVPQMDPDWVALTLVLSQHSCLVSRRVGLDSVWTHTVSRTATLDELRRSLDAITGLLFQGGNLEPADASGFRAACLSVARRIVQAGISSQSIIALVNKAIANIDTLAVDSADLGVFFCPENVVWNEHSEDWIPSPETTVKPEQPLAKGAKPAASSGVTKEDMMRQTLKEQTQYRKKINDVANRARFSLELLANVVTSAADAAEVTAVAVSKIEDVITLLRSPITSASARLLVDAFLQQVAVPETSGALLYAVAMKDTCLADSEEFVAFFDAIATRLESTELALVFPVFKAVVAPVAEEQFRADSALAAMGALTRLAELQAPLDVPAVLVAVDRLSKISPGPFASSIGKLLRLLAPAIDCIDRGLLFATIAVTDDVKLFSELASALVLIDASLIRESPRLQALVLLGNCEEVGAITRPLVGLVDMKSAPVELINLLHGPALVQRLASESLAFVCSHSDATVATVASILTMCEREYVETSGDRMGFAMALGAVSKISLANDADFLASYLRFVVGTAMRVPSLTTAVRDQLLAGIQDALSANGEQHARQLLTLTESFVGAKEEAAALTVPVIVGLLVKFLPATDETVQSARTKLVAELLTTSAVVQTKIAVVLPPVLKMAEDVSKYLETFLNTALSTADPRARYGAALGVGAAVKAHGVAILRQLEVLKRVQEAAEDSKNPDRRQGAIAVYGGLSLSLGRLFEPYVAQILPVLLVAFGDNNAAVRDASNLAASQIMANLSTHGIKLVLPSLLQGVQDLQWRTKLGSIKLLSAMLSCAPKQLAACLPRVVPALSDVATDTHSKVREAACISLGEVGLVIANPEIKAIAHKLVAALTDPANDALRQDALDVLLSTSFVHSLDAASLALVVPVMLRATRERRSEIKRKGAQILGSIAVLSADAAEGLGPYMDRIVPALQDVLIDPIPDVRATAAKALGTMARALPEVIVAEVLPWLFTTLKEADSQVERSGAAHGLSEVLVELGPDQFVKILPEIVANAVNPKTNPEAREGYMGLFVFLPGVMRNAFVPYIDAVFPVLIQGLSDALQPVREVAFRAANALCVQFGASHATLLLPSLEKGLFARDWRARQASVHLVGQTLEQLMKSARGGNKDNLLETQVALTQEKRSYMLGMLYIVRSDPNQVVNQNAQSVWKTVVSNTPRTLRLILPILVRLIISNLSSSEEETRQLLAGRCLGDLVGKLGDRVLPDLMPILIENVNSEDPLTRAGVCVGLADIVTAAHRQLLQEYFSIMFPAVRTLLCDESVVVRARAGSLLAVLFSALGNTTVNNTLPMILDSVLAGDKNAVFGLEQLVSALSRDLLGTVVDALAVEPPTAAKLRGLETVAVAPVLEAAKFVSRIVAYLMTSFSAFPEETLHAGNELFGRFNRHSCHLALIELIRGIGDKADGKMREACASLIASCVKCAPLEVVAEYLDTLLPVLLRGALADEYQPAMESALLAFGEVSTKLTKETMAKHMKEIVDCVEGIAGVPGLALPRTFETLWPIYQQALMFGSSDAREAASKGLLGLVLNTPIDRLKPNAIKVTGPLIRVLGDRYPPSVRVPLLKTLQVLLQRLEAALKPFFPQLQTTYQKCAQDTDAGVKQLAEESQALLTKFGARPIAE